MENLEQLIKDAEKAIEKSFLEGNDKYALVLASRLLKVDAENYIALKILGVLYLKFKDFEKAITCLQEAIKLDPESAENYNNLSICYASQRKWDLSIPLIEKAIDLDPDKSLYYKEYGLQLANSDKSFVSATAAITTAIQLEPQSVNNWISLGCIHGNNLETKLAIDCFYKALELEPENAEAKVCLSNALFLNEEWTEGWKYYEARMNYFEQVKYFDGIYDKEKLWKGEPLDNKTIVLYCEQGAGDYINFIRYIPELKNCNVLLHTPEPLIELFTNNTTAKVLPNCGKESYDYHCSILSLPHLLNTTDFKKSIYLDTKKTIDFSNYSQYLKIGIAWAGSPLHPNDRQRSIELKFFKELGNLPNVKLFGLQKDLRLRAYIDDPHTHIDLAKDCNDMKIVLMTDYMNNYDDTLAIVKELDLIITVDTSLLHLAGAAGKKVWGLIPYVPDWRWGIDSEDTKWYQNVTLFRQSQKGNWQEVFDKVLEKLNENLL